MKMVSEVTLMTLRPFRALFYNFGVICCHSRPQNDLNVLKLSLETIIICILLLLRSFWVATWLVCYKFEFWVKNGPEWSRNGPKMTPKLPKMTSTVSMRLPKLPPSDVDVEHSLILDDNVFPLLAAWITSHQKRLESGPWLDIKLSHDMGWAWDTRPLVELLTHTQFEVYEVNNWTMNSITGNNKIGVKPWEFAFQEFLEEHKRRFLEFGATLHECSIPTHYNLQLKYFLP